MPRQIATPSAFLVALGLTALPLSSLGCDSCSGTEARPRASAKPSASALGNASASASVAAPAAAPKAPPGKPLLIETEDDLGLHGEVWAGPDASAPLAILVHRYRGERSEWQPLVDRLVARKQYRVVSFDLRGHGKSRTGPKGKDLYWGAFERTKEVPQLIRDVRGAVAAGREGVTPRSTVLVGSSLGAALVAIAASEDESIDAVALVSPGAAIEGQSVYEPFAKIARRPTFLAAGASDNVSKAAMGSLQKMAKAATVHEYGARQHGAQFLGQEQPKLWDDLAAWLEKAPTLGDAGGPSLSSSEPSDGGGTD